MEATEKESRFKPTFSTTIITLTLLIIAITFFYLLDVITVSQLSPGDTNPNAFGTGKVLFAIISTIIAVAFLIWVKNFMKKRPYLGFTIGIIMLAVLEFAIYQKFQGPYTTTFSIIIAIVALAYMTTFFIKSRNNPKKVSKN